MSQFDALRRAIASLGGPVFAVLDGARFDDLPADLRTIGLSARALFRETGEWELERASPQLVAMNIPAAAEFALEAAIAQPCAVFWECADGEEALWRHLRKINQILVPVEGILGITSPERPRNEFCSVLFRHWDPNVLAAVLPVLSQAQSRRVFGPAGTVLFNAVDNGGLKRGVLDVSWPAPAPGPLRLEQYQVEQIAARHGDGRQRRLSAMLRETASLETEHLSERELRDLVAGYERSGQALGLTHERSIGLWSHLMISSGGRFGTQPAVREYIKSGPDSPDRNVMALADEVSRLLAVSRRPG